MTSIDLFRLCGDDEAAEALNGAYVNAIHSVLALILFGIFTCVFSVLLLKVPQSMPDIGSSIVLKMNQSLVTAASEGDARTLVKLIDDGAVVDWIASATSIGSSDNYKKNNVGSPLHCASRHGHEDSVRRLLEVHCYTEPPHKS